MVESSYRTLENEDKLPRLPVPLLMLTANQLVEALKPLVGQEEYEDIVNEAGAFVEDPLVNLVQSHLQAASENPSQSCYLNIVNEHTNPGVYGEIRGDTLPRNPYLVLEEDPYAKALHPPNQHERAASLINSSLKFIVSLRNGTLKPDLTPKNGNPLTMSCYMNLFGTARVPHTGKTRNHVAMHTFAHVNDSRHIVIICKNYFYKLEVLTEFNELEYEKSKTKHNIWFNDHELSLQLKSIVDTTSKIDQVSSNRNSIGCITTQTYKTWKAARKELKKSNEENLKILDDALFVVILDPSSPVTDQEKTIAISHGTSDLISGTNIQKGTCTSRWYDKLQLIVTKNAVAGIVWESASMDSTAILRFISDIYTDSVLKLAKNINGAEYTLFDDNVTIISSKELKPEVIPMTLNKTPELETLIHISETRLADLINQHQYNTFNLDIETYLMKKTKISIDSVLQIAFQISHYSLYGKMVNTIEPITTRKFRDSRTELIPIQNETIAQLVKLSITNADPEQKWELFKKCCDMHTKQYRDAMQGQGFERHLTALTQVVKRPETREFLNSLNKHLEPIPDLESIEDLYIPIISSTILEKIDNPELLISNCGNPALHLFGIPPAIDQGFGIGYIIHNDKVVITMCSKFRQSERFLNTFKRVIDDLKAIVKQRTNFLMNINDSTGRKLELQRIRIENELSHVVQEDVLLRHPIELSIDHDYEEYENQVGNKFAPIKVETSQPPPQNSSLRDRSLTLESSGSGSDYDLLGGYDYFDMGELDHRSTEMSKTQSLLDSGCNSLAASRYHSRAHSRINSNTNLKGMADDIKQKLSLSESIRDKLSHSNEASSENLIANRFASPPPMSSIGRQLNMDDNEDNQ